MTETEQELLSRISYQSLFRESKRTRVNPKDTEQETPQKVSVAASKTKKQPGGKKDVR